MVEWQTKARGDMKYTRYATFRDALAKRGGWKLKIVEGKEYVVTERRDFRPRETGEWIFSTPPELRFPSWA